jgi:YD repeat-containing protein
MKFLFASSSIFFLCSSLDAQPSFKQLPERKGVKSETRFHCTYGANDSTGLLIEDKKNYNKKGLPVLWTTWEMDSVTVSGKGYYLYDKNDHLTCVGIVQKGKKIPEYSCEYDKKGNLISIDHVLWQDANWLPDFFYKYDEQGRLIEETEKLQDGTTKRVQRYVYDNEGKLIEKEDSMSTGRSVDEISYSDKGKKTSVITKMYWKDTLNNISQAFFNEAGMRIKIIPVMEPPGSNYYRAVDSVAFHHAGDTLFEEHFNVIFIAQRAGADPAHFENLLINRKVYDGEDSIIRDEIYSRTTSYHEETYPFRLTVYSRNEKHQLVSIKEYRWPGLMAADAIPLRQTWFTSTGKVSKIETDEYESWVTYNEKDQEVESIIHYKKENTELKEIYSYTGETKVEIRSYSNNKLTEREVFVTEYY